MLNIYAQSMMTATRTGQVKVTDVRHNPKPKAAKSRWPSVPQWWVQRPRDLDLDKI